MVEKPANQEKEWASNQVGELKETFTETNQTLENLIKETCIGSQWIKDFNERQRMLLADAARPFPHIQWEITRANQGLSDLIQKTCISSAQWIRNLQESQSAWLDNVLKPIQNTTTQMGSAAAASLSLLGIPRSFNTHEELFNKAYFDSPCLRIINEDNQRLGEIIKKTLISTQCIADLQKVHHTWLDNSIKPIQDNFAHIQATAKLSLTNIARHLSISEKLFTGIDENLRKLAMPNNIISQSLCTFTNFTSSYERLASSIRSLPDLVELPAFALPGASRDILTTGYAISKICPDNNKTKNDEETYVTAETEQEVSACSRLLVKVNPALAELYIGAHDALVSGCADRKRHVLVSLRELFDHTLRHLAPNEQVIPWVKYTGNKDNDEYLQKGRPTRKARVLYICREINSGPFSEFVLQDTQAVLKLFNIFQRVHELVLNLSDEQLKALFLSTGSRLMYILRVWETTK